MQALGWRGSQRTVQRYLQPYRAGATVPEPALATPKPRRVTRWIMTDPERLTAGEATRLKEILTRCPELDAAHGHVAEFAAMLRNLRGEQLNDWMQAVQADDLPALHSLITGLRRDQLAVTNGLTPPWNSGPVEGAVNRIKALKRAMFGRANLDLLRRRILLPN
jgi:transposase